jgi:hypothetical protein
MQPWPARRWLAPRGKPSGTASHGTFSSLCRITIEQILKFALPRATNVLLDADVSPSWRDEILNSLLRRSVLLTRDTSVLADWRHSTATIQELISYP